LIASEIFPMARLPHIGFMICQKEIVVHAPPLLFFCSEKVWSIGEKSFSLHKKIFPAAISSFTFFNVRCMVLGVMNSMSQASMCRFKRIEGVGKQFA